VPTLAFCGCNGNEEKTLRLQNNRGMLVVHTSGARMANSVAVPSPAAVRTITAREAAEAMPWYAWTLAAAATCAIVGLHWDISWHMTIGRDTFWTPAHLCIQACAVIGCLSCAYLIFNTTLRGDAQSKHACVRVLGFYGPIGAFIAAWGGVAMLTSAPFDDWWHNAYGLDVKILSPPHVLLLVGIMSVEIGGLLLVMGRMNGAADALRRKLDWIFLYLGGVVLIQMMVLVYEYSDRVLQHSAIFYRAVGLAAPVVLVAMAAASGRRWAATTVAGVYMAFWAAMLWILPLFPAQPKLGPVYWHITHMVPMAFPVLLIAPAVETDWLRGTRIAQSKWKFVLAASVLFVVALAAAQWPFANLLTSSHANNWFFGGQYHAYFDPPNSADVRGVFAHWERTAREFWTSMGIALIGTVISTSLGLGCGNWMRRIRR
jgi:hypothetical protein